MEIERVNNFKGGILYLLNMSDCNRTGEADLARDFSESIFLLKKSSSNSTVAIQADFSPLSQKQEASPCVSKTLPTFNLDGNYFTPSFILEMDQERYAENKDLYMKIHDRKVIEISEQKAEILIPRPSKNNSFCCVCKMPFDDYLTHISTAKHRILIIKSDYNQKITHLCQKFKLAQVQTVVSACKEAKSRGRPKTKTIQKLKEKGKKEMPELGLRQGPSQLSIHA